MRGGDATYNWRSGGMRGMVGIKLLSPRFRTSACCSPRSRGARAKALLIGTALTLVIVPVAVVAASAKAALRKQPFFRVRSCVCRGPDVCIMGKLKIRSFTKFRKISHHIAFSVFFVCKISLISHIIALFFECYRKKDRIIF